ncbi:hypothetical protein [Kineococcus rhizosphaerae]|uniref:DUF8021 domain-containing protein n=1 Tax=Kineococcus rhizosphaerae TaxID=559628 RepID=A0A2T0RAT5_9ACTN|nr:hypothetical protein [Kineococcus rhizosphaerae]PRY18286.1 hypothetical protein CLV37_101531 [Kineococcus rhizosphaerae]
MTAAPAPAVPLDERATEFLHRLTVDGTGRSTSCRSTENGRDVPVDGGRLARANSFTGVQVFTDDRGGQAVVVGLAEFDDGHDAFALRLRFDGDLVTEAEAIVSTGRTGFFNAVDELEKPDVIYSAPVPPGRRSDAAELVRIADSYWEAMEQGDPSLVPVGYRCDSYHNGKKVTNNLELLLSPDKAVHSVASIIAGTRPARPTVADRRYPVVDVELGLVVSVVVADFHPVEGRPDCGSFYMGVVFKVVDHEIRIFDEVREILPLGTTSGWHVAQGAS